MKRGYKMINQIEKVVNSLTIEQCETIVNNTHDDFTNLLKGTEVNQSELVAFFKSDERGYANDEIAELDETTSLNSVIYWFASERIENK